jgi:pyruvate/2-oxoacid:ferredoxin oxidoreductase beta subunit
MRLPGASGNVYVSQISAYAIRDFREVLSTLLQNVGLSQVEASE